MTPRLPEHSFHKMPAGKTHLSHCALKLFAQNHDSQHHSCKHTPSKMSLSVIYQLHCSQTWLAMTLTPLLLNAPFCKIPVGKVHQLHCALTWLAQNHASQHHFCETLPAKCPLAKRTCHIACKHGLPRTLTASMVTTAPLPAKRPLARCTTHTVH